MAGHRDPEEVAAGGPGQRLGQEGGVQGFEDGIWEGGLDILTVIGFI